MDRDIAVASDTMRWWRALCFVWPLLFVGPASARAQDAARSCSLICELVDRTNELYSGHAILRAGSA